MTFYLSQNPEFTDEYIYSLVMHERDLPEPEFIGYDDGFNKVKLHRKFGGLRDRDIMETFKISPPPRANKLNSPPPVFAFISGVGGSMKSALLHPFLKDGSPNPWHSETIDPTAEVINPDTIKRELGYRGGDGLPYHERSMWLAEQRLQAARLQRRSVVLVTTHKTPGYLIEELSTFARSGFRLAGHYVGIDEHNAVRMSHARRDIQGKTAPIIHDDELLSNVDNYMNFIGCRMMLTDWTMRSTDVPSSKHYSTVTERSVACFIKAAEEYAQLHKDISAADIQRDFLLDYYLANELIDELVARGHEKRIQKRKSGYEKGI